ncbi:MAG: tryptophan--tRNA ligase [Cyanobacteria bacterium]|nr:tryptophan--tRNA ligase [Cyanobacteriota bacterium]MDA1020398.1 tryptophan--tRNA ligase [Cyanobacteriota bacterium]
MPKILLTGDRPTGPLHLGHYVGSLQNRVKLQNEQDTSGAHLYKPYILIADMQALTDNFETPDLVSGNILNVALDYLAVGIDPKLSSIYIQSQIPEFSELTMYFLNLLTLNQIERNPTVKEEIRQKNYEGQIPMGFLIYPVSQAADILAFKADVVPVGADQIPMIEDSNMLARKFNQVYKSEVLKECKALIPDNFGRLVGLDGKAKMSKSLGNAIYLKDTTDELWGKVRQMYTDPDHVKVEDPGKVEGNVCFTYLDAFGDDQAKVQELKDHYSSGGLGDMVVKKYVMEVLDAKLAPIRAAREDFAKEPAQVMAMLARGTEEARAVVQATMKDVKEAMGIAYDLSVIA